MLTISHDTHAGEIVIHTPQGMILINERGPTKNTRVVVLPSHDGYVSMSDGTPAIMVMWSGVQIVEPAKDDDDTEEMLPLFDEDEKAR